MRITSSAELEAQARAEYQRVKAVAQTGPWALLDRGRGEDAIRAAAFTASEDGEQRGERIGWAAAKEPHRRSRGKRDHVSPTRVVDTLATIRRARPNGNSKDWVAAAVAVLGVSEKTIWNRLREAGVDVRGNPRREPLQRRGA